MEMMHKYSHCVYHSQKTKPRNRASHIQCHTEKSTERHTHKHRHVLSDSHRETYTDRHNFTFGMDTVAKICESKRSEEITVVETQAFDHTKTGIHPLQRTKFCKLYPCVIGKEYWRWLKLGRTNTHNSHISRFTLRN